MSNQRALPSLFVSDLAYSASPGHGGTLGPFSDPKYFHDGTRWHYIERQTVRRFTQNMFDNFKNSYFVGIKSENLTTVFRDIDNLFVDLPDVTIFNSTKVNCAMFAYNNISEDDVNIIKAYLMANYEEYRLRVMHIYVPINDRVLEQLTSFFADCAKRL